MEWHRMHVHYYAPDKRELLLDGIRPFFHAVGDNATSMYFMRHWRQGPHLRLNVRTTASLFADVVRPLADDIIGGFLTRRPSTARLDPLHELPRHRRLAELELEDGPLLPWHPDNTIMTARHDPRTDAVGGRVAAEVLAQFQSDATELTFRMIDELTSRRQRLARAFDLMIVTVHAMSAHGIAGGFVSFRSHAEGFLHGFPEAAGLRDAWDRHYRAHRDELVRRVRTLVAAVDGDGIGIAHVDEWLAVLRSNVEGVQRLAEAGELTLPIGMPASAEHTFDHDKISPFHRVLLANPAWDRTLRSAEFVTYRVMLNLTFLTLTQIGITPVERLLLAHIAANAVEDANGISAVDLVRAPAPTTTAR